MKCLYQIFHGVEPIKQSQKCRGNNNTKENMFYGIDNCQKIAESFIALRNEFHPRKVRFLLFSFRSMSVVQSDVTKFKEKSMV